MYAKPWYGPPFTAHDRVYSLLGMAVGASLLTIAAFNTSLHESLGRLTTKEEITMKVIASLIYWAGMIWLAWTSKRQGLSVWYLLWHGNFYGGGWFGFAIYLFGTEERWKNYVVAAWGWIFGFVVFILGKGFCGDEEEKEGNGFV